MNPQIKLHRLIRKYQDHFHIRYYAAIAKMLQDLREERDKGVPPEKGQQS